MVLRFRPLRACISLLFLAAAAYGQQSTSNEPVPEDLLPGLRTVLAAAVNQSPDMISASIAVAQSEYAIEQSRSSFFPHLDASSSYNNSRSATAETQNIFGATGPPSSSNAFNYSVSVSQTIFQWGSIKAAFDSAKINDKSARLQLQDSYRRLALQIRRSYMDLVYAKMALAVAKTSRAKAGTDLAKKQADIDARITAEDEINGPRLADMQAELSLEQAQFNYDSQVKALKRVAGLAELPTIEDSIPAIAIEADTLTPRLPGFAGGPAVTLQGQIYSNSIKVTDLSLKIARNAYLPTFSAGASYGLGTNISVNGDAVSRSGLITGGWNVGFSWNIFNGFSTRASVRSSLANKRSTELQLRNYIDYSNEQLENQRQMLILAARQLKIAEVQLGFAQGMPKVLLQRRSEGNQSITTDDIDNAQFGVVTAELSTASVRTNFLNRSIEYISAAGADPALKYVPAQYAVPADGQKR